MYQNIFLFKYDSIYIYCINNEMEKYANSIPIDICRALELHYCNCFAI